MMATTTTRRLGAAALVAAATFMVAGPAAADTYAPTPEASMKINVLSPVCHHEVPYLQYDVTVQNTTHDTLTITWENPDGDDVVQSGLPLSGSVLWPGATIDADGNPTDWPGWHLENGTWVEGDEFDWTRNVDVLFHVNPETTVHVTYPESTPGCATNPPGTTPSENVDPGTVVPVSNPSDPNSALPQTGSEMALYSGVAAVLLAIGGSLLVWNRRSKNSRA